MYLSETNFVMLMARVCGVFKWSTEFRCLAKSPVVPVWLSLPYLHVPLFIINLFYFSTAEAIGTRFASGERR